MYGNDEILSFLKKRQGVLDGVAITGGEPTMMSGLYDFIANVKEMGYAVKLDTNGTRPDVLKRLVGDGLLDYVAMDIKNCPEKYAYTCGLPEGYDLSKIEDSKAFLMEERVDFEFRTTVAKPFHTPADLEKLAKWISGEERFFLQQFKDSGDILGHGVSAHSAAEMEELLRVVLPFVPNAQLRGV